MRVEEGAGEPNGRPRSRPPARVKVDASLRPELPSVVDGRAVVIAAVRFWQCGTWVGDLSVRLGDVPLDGSFVPLEPIEGVAVFAQRGLPRLLEKAGAVLERGVWPLRRGLRIRLERPEYWIDYLDRPARFESPE